ncbi:MAG TPA: autotransporter domain-containing protein [Xanthobacteraceae bacterium]
MQVRVGRHRTGLLLASSSAAALLAGGGTPPALAACNTSFTNTTAPGCSNAAAITGIAINNSTITSTISNAGTISPNGIVLTNGSTITGAIDNDGAINGGIAIDATSKITNNTAGIIIRQGSFAGGISNGGAIISSAGDSILVGSNRNASLTHVTFTLSTFAGGIINSGTLSSGHNGVVVGGNPSAGLTGDVILTISTFSGGITNLGTITAVGAGLAVGGSPSSTAAASSAVVFVSSFSGAVSNHGTISAGTDGIVIGGAPNHLDSVVQLSVFASGVTNSGTISANESGIVVGGNPRLGATLTISTFAGGISNSGTITTGSDGIVLGGSPTQGSGLEVISTFSGGITNSRLISAGSDGIVVGGNPSLSSVVRVRAFTGGITNLGTISANGLGIVVGGSAARAGNVTISSFAGGVSNAGTITTGVDGIVVGGRPNRSNAFVAISTFAGGITNSGTVSAGGLGIAVGGSPSLTGAVVISMFTGGISNSNTISAGTIGILVGNGNPLGTGSVSIATFTGGITNSGSVGAITGIRVDGSVATFIGAIVNSGTIVGTGGTAIDVSLANSAMTVNQTAGSIGGDIKLSSHADVLNITGGTLGGNIVGSGASDTVNFSPGAGNTFTYGAAFGFSAVNQVNIASGTVVLNGANSATNVDVTGGTLAGTGTLDPLAVTIHAGGTFAPGNGTPGSSMAITGNLAFQPGATYQVQLNPAAASFATVSGTVALAGSVLAIFAPGTYVQKQYMILQSGGLSGTFANVNTQNVPANFTASLSQNADDVFLNLVSPLAAPGNSFNINQSNVANAINGFFNGGGALPPSFVGIIGLTGPNLANALTKLDGEAAADAQKGALDLMTGFLNLMLDPFVDGRGSAGGGSATGFAAEPASLPPDVALAYASVLKAPPKPVGFEQRWSAWGAGFGGFNTTKGDPVIGSTNVTASAFGFAAGVDYRVSPDTILGFALAGGGTNWGLAQNLGGGRSDAFQAGVYGTTHLGAAYAAGALAFANHWMTIDRFAPSDHLQADFNAQSYGARLEAGYRFSTALGNFGIAPYAAAQTQRFHTPSFSETDLTGTGFGLAFAAMNATDTRSELGARFDTLQVVDRMPLILRARAAWAHDWVTNPALDAVFQALPGASFIVNGAAPSKNSALASAGGELKITRDWSFLTRFDGEFSSTTRIYTGTLMVRKMW